MSSTSLSGKVAIVTGASSGIGFGIAIHLAKLGVKLVITGRNSARLNDAKMACIKAGAKDAHVVTVVGEITEPKVRSTLIQTTLDHFGVIDILVNNAGIAVPHAVCDDNGSIDKFDQIINVNVRAVIELCRLSAEHLIKSKGNLTMAHLGYYCMSKAALDMFTKVLAQELAPKGVRVNSINPGVVDTPILDYMKTAGMTDAQIRDRFNQIHPLGRVGMPKDIANAIELLVSDQASWITGTILKVDGGNLIRAEQIVAKQ